MLIPNADRAVIERAKLHDYLLSRSHPVGRFKAAFFQALGYSSEDWRQLDADLRSQHREATADEPIPYGQKYVIRATLVGSAAASECEPADRSPAMFDAASTQMVIRLSDRLAAGATAGS